MTNVKYPGVEVQLTGEDGNAFMIIMRVERAMKLSGVTHEECMLFRDEATSGDYDHLLQTAMRWVAVS